MHKITIIPRTSGALGYTMQIDESERNLFSKEDLENRIATLTGGRAAEEVILTKLQRELPMILNKRQNLPVLWLRDTE